MRKFTKSSIFAIPAILAILAIAPAGAQGVRYDLPPILGQNGLPLHNVGISLCPGTATITGTTCSPATQSVTDITGGTQCASGLPVTLPGSNICKATSDAFGNAGFWLAPGSYIYCENGPGITGQCFNLTLPVGASAGGAAALLNLDDILWVGAGGYANIAAAESAAGNTNKTIITVRSTYTGTDCPVASTNRVVWDFRGTAAAAGCNQNVIEYNTNDGNVTAMVKEQQNLSTIDAAGSNVAHWILSVYNNGATGNLVEGASTESVIGGSFSANTLTILQGNESVASIQSTGGTVTNAVGVNGYASNINGATTAITNVIGVKGTGCSGTIASATKPTNCYGLYGVDQFSTASGKNYSAGFEGPIRWIWSSTDGFAGADLDDNSGVPHPFIRMLSGTNRSDIQAINTNGLGLNDSGGTQRALVTSAGFAIQNTANAAGLQFFNNTTTCTTAASVGATCTTAAISLPVGEADTNYRVSCWGNGTPASGVPVVTNTTKSSATQFTITIAALTAVAASFASYDCLAGHN